MQTFVAPFDVHFRKKDIKDPDVMQPDIIVLCDLENNINEKGISRNSYANFGNIISKY